MVRNHRAHSPCMSMTSTGVQTSPPNTCPEHHCNQLSPKDAGVRFEATRAEPRPTTTFTPHRATTKTANGTSDTMMFRPETQYRQITATVSDSATFISIIGIAATGPMPNRAVEMALAKAHAVIARSQLARCDVSNSAIKKALAAQMKAMPPSKHDVMREREATRK